MKWLTLQTLLKLRLSLPLTKKQRDTVIKIIIQKYHEWHPTTITHKIGKQQWEKRKREGLDTSPTIQKWREMKNTAFNVPVDWLKVWRWLYYVWNSFDVWNFIFFCGVTFVFNL